MAKILVVDDRPFNRQFLLTLLKHTGHELREAVDGAQALEIVRAERPNLVISDILMPTMDGFQFARSVRSDPTLDDINVIFYTATYREPEARALAAACGVRTVLPKPSDPDVILSAVETALGSNAVIPALAGLIPPVTEAQQLKRIDEQLSWYSDELRTVEDSFQTVLNRMSLLLAEREEIRSLSSRFTDNFVGLRRLSAKLATLIEIMLDVNPERGPVHLLELFLDAGRKVLGAKFAAAAVFDDTTKELQHLVARGFDGSVYLDATDVLAGVPGSLLGRQNVLRVGGGEAAWGPDDFPIAHPSLATFLGVEIPFRDGAQGWIYFGDKIGGDFDSEDEHLLSTIAAQLGVAYANTVVFDLLQHHAAKLQIEITAREKAEDEMRKREEQLNQARKMEAIGQLTGGISHDFNNLLTVIKGNAENLAEAITDPGLRQQVSLIEQAANRGADLVGRLLAFARKQDLTPEVVDLNAQLASFLKLVRSALAENVKVRLQPAESLAPVFVDPGSLENALLNLAINARDAMPSGGTITITTDVVTLGAVEAGAAALAPGRYVTIAVRDTGTGMDKDVIARVFEPFFTTKEVGKGTGLGLSMVWGFVKQSGGHAEILSERGIGTTVKLFLPAARGVTARLHVGEPSPPPSAPKVTQPLDTEVKAKILLVEDDELVRESVSVKLGRLGYAVSAVAAAKDALAAFPSGAFDLVMTDVIMPGDMNGGDLAREILRRWPGTKILATSGYTETALLGKVTMPDGVRVLAKPYSTADLVAAIRTVIGA